MVQGTTSVKIQARVLLYVSKCISMIRPALTHPAGRRLTRRIGRVLADQTDRPAPSPPTRVFESVAAQFGRQTASSYLSQKSLRSWGS